MNDPAIKAVDLKKSFGDNEAVGGLALEIKKGELFGLVGPDGAGKTTVIRMLAAIMEPTSGEAWIMGRSVLSASESIRDKTGYMPQRFGLYEDLTVIENLLFYADVFDVPQKERNEKTKRLLGFSNLTPFRDRLAGKLSGGMKQKLGLACALIHTPEVLFLDEPTNGVDPVSRRDFWRLLYDLLREGVTIFVSTSYLDEAERCTRICLMHKGRVMIDGSPEEVKKSAAEPMIEIRTPHAKTARDLTLKMPGVRSVTIYGGRIHATLDNAELGDTVVSALRKAGLEIGGCRRISHSIEDIFISRVSGQ